jgi:uncharacterized membrane-anchored protein YhcB (DUF1043 family)
MKRIFITILTGTIFTVLTVLNAEEKERKSDDFLRINDNIQNEELRSELEGLREEFNIERSQIQKFYTEKIALLKEARRNEIKTMKNDFAERRKMLMKKHFGKLRKKPQMNPAESIKNAPVKKKVPPKDKKRVRKP